MYFTLQSRYGLTVYEIIYNYISWYLDHDQVKTYPNNARKCINIIYPIPISIDTKNLSLKYITWSLLGEGQWKLPFFMPRRQIYTNLNLHHSGLPSLGLLVGRKRGQGIYLLPPPYIPLRLQPQPLSDSPSSWTWLCWGPVTLGVPGSSRRYSCLYPAIPFWRPNFWENCSSELLFLVLFFPFLFFLFCLLNASFSSCPGVCVLLAPLG